MNTVISSVTSSILRRQELSSSQIDEMYRLLDQHFEGVTPVQFERDLGEKNCVLLLSRAGELVGFSTVLSCTTSFEGQLVNLIYSGDTIVAPAAWGSTALPRAWVAAVEDLRSALPEAPCFWLLLTSGFRTYRFLPLFWREFFPRFDRITPPDLQRLLDHCSRERFGPQFDSRRGIVRFRQPQRLRMGLNGIPEGRADDPHIAFFASRNPGHAGGDELVCLTRICPENLTAAGRRMTTLRSCALNSSHR